ncbi:hypothetical protein ARTSIC4J27_619 [Pseudarthrobacter siccitolerans]|uniref:Uncharacterized protein n=1 Tax=Pseudarthrobacter siccitolerans TaxID=861266 RepID=A0A024GXK3_9MICC|nr:hypothetical protein [Pseudarthrobacter siccitolerans]CCQ44690.1 hypothetical protein ARTSIC4J27_619 [Pseudarthrobacter siccitolerans]
MSKPKPLAVFRDSEEHPMNEVLADFIGSVVTVTRKDGRRHWGLLRPEVLDDYEVVMPDTGAPLATFDRQEIVELAVWSEA